jgi:hypothetical protein
MYTYLKIAQRGQKEREKRALELCIMIARHVGGGGGVSYWKEWTGKYDDMLQIRSVWEVEFHEIFQLDDFFHNKISLSSDMKFRHFKQMRIFAALWLMQNI